MRFSFFVARMRTLMNLQLSFGFDFLHVLFRGRRLSCFSGGGIKVPDHV